MDMAYYVLMMQADARREAAEYRRTHPPRPRQGRRRRAPRREPSAASPAGAVRRPAAA